MYTGTDSAKLRTRSVGDGMIVGIRDTLKLIGIVIVAACAVFVCTLFLNYNIDLAEVRDSITTEAGVVLYNAQVSMGKVTCAVTGGCLVVTSVIMLLFYVKNYIDSHKRELGILKALGYSNIKTALHFSVFGVSALLGAAAGFASAWSYMPRFYSVQNADGLFPDVPLEFHPVLMLYLTAAPALLFAALSVFYAAVKLKMPVMELLREKTGFKGGTNHKSVRTEPFLMCMKKGTLRTKKVLAFFMGFSAFCFSAMTQMSMSMTSIASNTFAFMIITIGLILAFTTLFMVLDTVIKSNAKSIAMMRVFGYSRRECSSAVLGVYRPVSYIGFAVGSVYQYVLLKMVMTFVFDGVGNMPEYSFDTKALIISFAAFVLTYEVMLYAYSYKINRQSPKMIMAE